MLNDAVAAAASSIFWTSNMTRGLRLGMHAINRLFQKCSQIVRNLLFSTKCPMTRMSVSLGPRMLVFLSGVSSVSRSVVQILDIVVEGRFEYVPIPEHYSTLCQESCYWWWTESTFDVFALWHVSVSRLRTLSQALAVKALWRTAAPVLPVIAMLPGLPCGADVTVKQHMCSKLGKGKLREETNSY